MTELPHTNPRLAVAIKQHPRIAKAIAALIVVALFTGISWGIWHDVSRGRYAKTLAIVFIASIGGWRTYRQAKEASRS